MANSKSPPNAASLTGERPLDQQRPQQPADGGVVPACGLIPGGGADANLAVETHSYDPFEVCGTGTEPWGKPSDVAAMHAMFGNTTLWGAQHGGLPVFMGESGCTRKQNRTGRLAWYSAFFDLVRGLPGQGGGGLVWDDEEDYEVYNRTARTFDEGILTAIGL
jgi:hypothetical protein